MGEEPVGAVLAVEAVQTCQADPTVDVGEQTHSARENAAQVFAQVVGQAHAVSDEILAGAAGVSQSRGRRTVGSQRPQPGAIGTQRVASTKASKRSSLLPAEP